MERPLLIFDGDCGFCRVWIVRWKRLTRGRVDCAPSQEVGKDFPDIPATDYQKAVQLIEPDGRRTSAAAAVFRALAYGGHSGMWEIYQKLPGFARFSEWFYGIVAGHRPTFSTFTRWLWGNAALPSSYRMVRWVFLRALAVIYGIAFCSLGVQIRGLIGAEGISPAHDLLTHLAPLGPARFWYVPSLAWFNSSDDFLLALCAAGAAASLLVLINSAPRLFLFACWGLYLSLVSVGGDFMSFQWDVLLLETGFLAIFLAPQGHSPQREGAPGPSPLPLFLLRWLLFRLMLQSALVKWLSGDVLWHHFTALTVHYQTQPLPNPLSWYVHQWPVGFHKVSCIGMFAVEGLVPFLMLMPRRARAWAFWPTVGLQTLILLTGNYTFFNVLTISLCVLLLEDAQLRRWLPAWCVEPLAPEPEGKIARSREWGLRAIFVLVIWLTLIPFGRVVGIQLPRILELPAVGLSPLRSFNSYGLFAVMTPKRPEIIVEGSDDGKTWKAYEFKYMPGDLSRRPAQVAPFQPRLDWQMWFAALGDFREYPWFLNFCVRLFEDAKPVTRLLRSNPFPDKPPLYLRATLYDYRFTTPEERKQTGQWWARRELGPYIPTLARKPR